MAHAQPGEIVWDWGHSDFSARVFDGRIEIAIGDKSVPGKYEQQTVYLSIDESVDLMNWLIRALTATE